MHAERADRSAALKIEKKELETHTSTIKTAFTKVHAEREKFESKMEKLVRAFNNLEVASPAGKDQAAGEYEVEHKETRAAHVAFEVAVRRLKLCLDNAKPVRQRFIEALNHVREIDPDTTHEDDLRKALIDAATLQMLLNSILCKQGRDLQITSRGESIGKLLSRKKIEMDRGESAANEELMGLQKKELDKLTELSVGTIQLETMLEEIPRLTTSHAHEKTLKMVSNFLDSNSLKLDMLHRYKNLIPNHHSPVADLTELTFLKKIVGNELNYAVKAHIEMRINRGNPSENRISTYENAFKQYESYAHAIRSLKEMGSTQIRVEYQEPFQQCLEEARVIAEKDLAAAIREVEEVMVLPRSSLPLRRNPQETRNFKLHNKGALAKKTEVRQSKVEGESIENRVPQSGEIINTLQESPQVSDYTEIEQRLTAAQKPVLLSATSIIAAGKKLLLERTRFEAMIQREIGQLKDPSLREEKRPAEWNTLLEQLAEKLDSIIAQLDLVESANRETSAAIKAFRTEAQSLRHAGLEHRNAGYKRQAPTAEKVLALWQSAELSIEPLKNRQATNARDFLTEFAIRDKHTNEVLWYAHFHYTNSTDPDLAYTAAHLKRADQRFIGFKAQLKQALEDRQVVRIWRSKVPTEMAGELFFKTA
ncbi:hypothetical protein CRX42_08000 [Pseudomonas jessenii]|uniref:Uncharacterized protein n=1 Tax=Pseudomonas jessenii TaxID=77298 RepID=A0A2W0ERT5_PSEJE|nr:hypothetical protein CRX42_08000 [Pseudomonas jessenii]